MRHYVASLSWPVSCRTYRCGSRELTSSSPPSASLLIQRWAVLTDTPPALASSEAARDPSRPMIDATRPLTSSRPDPAADQATGIEYDVCMHVYTPDMCYAYRYSEDERSYLAGRMAVTETDETTLDFLDGQEIVKVLYQNTDTSYLRSIASELSDVTGDIDVSYSSGRYLEFNAHGVNKGAGLLRLTEALGVDPADTIAIGDNWNGWPMIRDAGLGVCVANAVEDMKPQCDYVCEATCNQSAVAEVIERFVLT